MSTKKNATQLSPNWVETMDMASGRPYYANTATKEVTWTKPVDKIKEDLAKNGKKPASKKKEKQDVWLERQDPSTGRTYYFNPKLKKTAWHRPEKVISADAHKQAADGKGAWVERLDPRTGRAYYFNPVLSITSWTNPDLEEDQPAEKKGNRLSAAFNRLSMGLSGRFGGKKGADGAATFENVGERTVSARFSTDNPALPINRSSARVSMRLGGDDLADKFAALREMQQMSKPETEVAKDVINEPSAKQSLLIDLQAEMDTLDLNYEMKSLTEYATEKFDRKKGGMFSSKRAVPVENLTGWQRTMIKKPLHAFGNKALTGDAFQSFKLILMYSGDKPKKGKVEDGVYAQSFAAFGINTLPEFQAELYCQLIKQTTRNPHQENMEMVFELLALVCGCFKPTEDLMPYVKSHLRTNIETPASERIKLLALYGLLRLERGVDRVEAPSLQEVAAVRSVAPVQLKIGLVQGAQDVDMQVDCWVTVKEIKDAIENRFQIKDGNPFALYEMSQGGEMERVLEETDSILDLLSYWERGGGDFQATYKMRLYFDINEEDTAALELAYLQAVQEVLDQRYPCEKEDALRLAAIEAQRNFGDFVGTDVFGENLAAYLPPKYYDPDLDAIQETKDSIYREYSRIAGSDKVQCMVNYLNYVKRWKLYGSAYYFAKPIQLKVLGKEFPENILIGINAKGVLILDQLTLDLIVEYPYSELVTWGHSVGNFVLVVGNLVRSTKIFFTTVDGSEMNSLIHAYVSKLMEAQTEEEKAEMMANQFRE